MKEVLIDDCEHELLEFRREGKHYFFVIKFDAELALDNVKHDVSFADHRFIVRTGGFTWGEWVELSTQ